MIEIGRVATFSMLITMREPSGMLVILILELGGVFMGVFTW